LETGSVSSSGGEEDTYSVGSLRKRKWLRLALSKGPNWEVSSPPPLTWGQKQTQFLKCFFFLVSRILEDGQSPKTQ
jgi:hypothetical protein